MSEPQRLSVSANGVRLNLYRLGPEAGGQAPTVVMLHGMRDVGLSLLPVAEAVAETHPVLLMDLRGLLKNAVKDQLPPLVRPGQPE